MYKYATDLDTMRQHAQKYTKAGTDVAAFLEYIYLLTVCYHPISAAPQLQKIRTHAEL